MAMVDGGNFTGIGGGQEILPPPEDLKRFADALNDVTSQMDSVAKGLAAATPFTGPFAPAMAGAVAALTAISGAGEIIANDARRRARQQEGPESQTGEGAGPVASLSDGLAGSIEVIDNASVTFDALVQAFGETVARMDDASKRLQDAIDELFGPPRGEVTEGLREGFQRASFTRPVGRGGGIGSGGFTSAGGGARDERVDAVIAGLEEAKAITGEFGEALFGLEGVGKRAFAGLEGALGEFVRTGKFEWRGLADVAIRAIRDIVDEQLRASGASSSSGGGGSGGLDSIVGSLISLGASYLGSPGGGASAAQSTALSLSGPRFQFAHGGRPPLGVASLVGEQGPELFIPDDLGTIVPNNALGGGGAMTVNVTQNFDFRGADLAAVAALRRESVRIKREVMAEIINSARRGGVFARLPRV